MPESEVRNMKLGKANVVHTNYGGELVYPIIEDENEGGIKVYRDILGQAEQYLNVSEVERAVSAIKDFIPSIVQLNKSIYEEMLKQGFNETQAFKFSCDYTIAIVFQGK